MTAFHLLDGPDKRLLLLCDHASNRVPPGIGLGIEAEALQRHIAWDIGAAAVTGALAERLCCPALLAGASRLVVDCNRPLAESVVPESDGLAIAGNRQLAPSALAARHALHRQYHDRIAALIDEARPRLLVAVHSFTPQLAASPVARPWPIALLWNEDERAASLGLTALAAEPGLPGPVGANQPYSGKLLNYTMNRHGEANGIPYLGFEIRQDLLETPAGQRQYAEILARTVRRVLEGL